MAQGAADLGLVDQHLHEVVILGQVTQHPFDRHDVLLAPLVEGFGPVDLGHTAECDAVEEVIAPQLLSARHALILSDDGVIWRPASSDHTRVERRRPYETIPVRMCLGNGWCSRSAVCGRVPGRATARLC